MKNKKNTSIELTIINAIKNNCNWLARDMSGKLFAYANKPIKKEYGEWVQSLPGTCFEIPDFSNLFKNIKWEDDNPVELKNMIKESV